MTSKEKREAESLKPLEGDKKHNPTMKLLNQHLQHKPGVYGQKVLQIEGEIHEREVGINRLNSQQKATENEVVGLEQEIDLSCVCGMEAFKALIEQHFDEKKVIKVEHNGQIVQIYYL
ncbi:unnamed protein product [Linum trigynum]|uniref:Uncharacterized protein n=1 Tax=Linum trigynum TaxID=586398 RepID=A0AAV2CV35_9ROSI